MSEQNTFTKNYFQFINCSYENNVELALKPFLDKEGNYNT